MAINDQSFLAYAIFDCLVIKFGFDIENVYL